MHEPSFDDIRATLDDVIGQLSSAHRTLERSFGRRLEPAEVKFAWTRVDRSLRAANELAAWLKAIDTEAVYRYLETAAVDFLRINPDAAETAATIMARLRPKEDHDH